MIDVKTLRIGSHVAICGGERVIVTAIRSNGIVTTTLGDMDEKNLTPISITPELLKELGFEYHEYNNGKLWEWDLPDQYKAYGYLEFDEDTTTIWQGRLWYQKEYEVDLRVEYLHDLENIFYMFYNKELITD